MDDSLFIVPGANPRLSWDLYCPVVEKDFESIDLPGEKNMADESNKAASIPFDQFTESTLAAVYRAIAAQKLPHAPILIGIVIDPALGGVFRNVQDPAKKT